MNYVIRNNKGVYIRLNNNGKAVTCSKDKKTIFEYSKAKNIVDNLQSTLRRLNFKVEPLPEIISKKELDKAVVSSPMELVNENCEISDEILQWVEKFKTCDSILIEAKERKKELRKQLSNVDKQFCDLVHEIEFEGKIDLYGGWLERNKIKENREKRRKIKDELSIISVVIRRDVKNINIGLLNTLMSNLINRKYIYRIIEEDECYYDNLRCCNEMQS